MANYKVKHIAKYEVGYRPHSHWEEKEFGTKWEAEKFCEEWRRKHLNGAYVESKTIVSGVTADDIRASHTVRRVLGW